MRKALWTCLLIGICGACSDDNDGPLADRNANAATTALAAKLDSWGRDSKVGIGQTVNVDNSAWDVPLDVFETTVPPVVALDLQELHDGLKYGTITLQQVIALAASGSIIQTTWHAFNPHTFQGSGLDRTDADATHGSWDTSWHQIAALLDSTTPEYATFWGWWDSLLAETVLPLQNAGVALIFRPFHEANASFFWWGKPSEAPDAWIQDYKALWTLMQSKAFDAGVHNLVWSYTVVPQTWSGISDPVSMAPDAIDIIGLDAYDDVTDSWSGAKLVLSSYRELSALGKRMSFSEVGPAGFTAAESVDKTWDPAVVSTTVQAEGISPLFVVFWFDDSDGYKQLNSLDNGPAWVATSENGFFSRVR